MSSHHGMRSNENKDSVRWPTDEENIAQRKLNDNKYEKSNCNLEFPFTYRSKQIYGCIVKGQHENEEKVGPGNECCTQVELTSMNDINSIMWNQMPELKGKKVTGRYIKLDIKDNDYYSHESHGALYLCVNDHRQWQVIL